MSAFFDWFSFKKKCDRIISDSQEVLKVDGSLSTEHRIFNKLARRLAENIIVDGKQFDERYIFVGRRNKTIDVCIDGLVITVQYETSEWGLVKSRTFIREVEKYTGDRLLGLLSVFQQMTEC